MLLPSVLRAQRVNLNVRQRASRLVSSCAVLESTKVLLSNQPVHAKDETSSQLAECSPTQPVILGIDPSGCHARVKHRIRVSQQHRPVCSNTVTLLEFDVDNANFHTLCAGHPSHCCSFVNMHMALDTERFRQATLPYCSKYCTRETGFSADRNALDEHLQTLQRTMSLKYVLLIGMLMSRASRQPLHPALDRARSWQILSTDTTMADTFRRII